MDQDNKNGATDAKKSYAGEYTFRFLIPTGIAGGIIGKGGDRVKSLNKKVGLKFIQFGQILLASSHRYKTFKI